MVDGPYMFMLKHSPIHQNSTNLPHCSGAYDSVHGPWDPAPDAVLVLEFEP